VPVAEKCDLMATPLGHSLAGYAIYTLADGTQGHRSKSRALLYGIPLLWPLSAEHFISPISVFLGVRHAATASTSTLEWLEAILHPYNRAAIAVEVGLLLPFVLLGQWRRSILLGQQELD
jgi:hypothetical protein